MNVQDSDVRLIGAYITNVGSLGEQKGQVSLIYGRDSEIETRKVNVSDIESRFISSISSQTLIAETRIGNITIPTLDGLGLYSENSYVQIN